MNNLSNSRWNKQFLIKFRKQFVIGQLVLVFCLGIFFHWIFSNPSSKKPISEKGNSVSYEMEQQKFWTCSMHPNIQKQKPGKCPICGMELIPVASETKDMEMRGIRQIVISEAARELMNIQTTPVERRYVTAEVRMVGKVDFDETRLGYITAWISGRLDRLYVDYTGVAVKKGDHMVYIYSPELYSTQDELIQVLKHKRKLEGETTIFPDVVDLVGPVRERLRLWGMTKEQILEIEESQKPSDHLTIYSPMSGIVIQKNRQEGDYVNVGDRIYTVADLNHVWVMLDAYESDLVWLRYGQEVIFTTEAYPGDEFIGKIAFIEPVLNEKTRTVKVRVNVSNLSGKLKPEMFVRGIVRTQISSGGRVLNPQLQKKWICPMHPEIIKNKIGVCDNCGMSLVRPESLGYVAVDNGEKSKPLIIPVSAALVTGTRAIVYVELPGSDQPIFEGREVVLGPRAGDYYLVKSGLNEGELVVINGNFKIDSAIQINAKPSMMTPLGGGGGENHHHSNETKPSKTGDDKMMSRSNVPAEFERQLQKLESAYEAVSLAAELKDIGPFRDTLQSFREILSEVDGTLLTGSLQMLWSEFSMLLNNDVVEGRGIKKSTEIEHLINVMEKNMVRVRDQFNISATVRSIHSPHRIEVPSAFKSQLFKLWEIYLTIQKALSSDDVTRAQKATKHFETSLTAINPKPLNESVHDLWKKESTKFFQIVKSMNQAKDLKSVRENFSSLSQKIFDLMDTFGSEGFGNVYQLHCPMAFDGEGAMWLQGDKQVSNPYFGQAMLTCADKVELIFSNKTEKHDEENNHVQQQKAPSIFTSHIFKLWDGYLSLQKALASDNMSLTRDAINNLQATIERVDTTSIPEKAYEFWTKQIPQLNQIVTNMNEAEAINSIREDFSLLTDELLILVRNYGLEKFGTVYKLHCPMAFGGKGAMWLQGDKQVSNPYFGKAMLKCADKVELISQGQTEDPKGTHHHE